jgi:hypothetical protein
VPTVTAKRPGVNSPASFGRVADGRDLRRRDLQLGEQLQQRGALVGDGLGQVDVNIRPDQVDVAGLGRAAQAEQLGLVAAVALVRDVTEAAVVVAGQAQARGALGVEGRADAVEAGLVGGDAEPPRREVRHDLQQTVLGEAAPHPGQVADEALHLTGGASGHRDHGDPRVDEPPDRAEHPGVQLAPARQGAIHVGRHEGYARDIGRIDARN